MLLCPIDCHSKISRHFRSTLNDNKDRCSGMITNVSFNIRRVLDVPSLCRSTLYSQPSPDTFLPIAFRMDTMIQISEPYKLPRSTMRSPFLTYIDTCDAKRTTNFLRPSLTVDENVKVSQKVLVDRFSFFLRFFPPYGLRERKRKLNKNFTYFSHIGLII